MNAFKDAGHLFRLAAVFLVIGILVFLGLRAFLVPKSFGEYGHYRGNAIGEIAARPVNFAGHQTCEDLPCRRPGKEESRKARAGQLRSVSWALAKHADDPASVQPAELDTAVLCVRCHEANVAKPKAFPQVVSADHSSGIAL